MLLDDIWIKVISRGFSLDSYICNRKKHSNIFVKLYSKITFIFQREIGLNKKLHCRVEEMYLASNHFKLGLFLSFFFEKREPDTVFEEKRKKWRSNSFNLESTWSPVDWQKKPHWSHFFHEQYRTDKPTLYTAKRILERLGLQTSSSYVKIW